MADKTKGKKKGKRLSCEQRRKELLKLMLASGHPRAISQTAYAKQFNVVQSQIAYDQKAIKDEIRKVLDEDIKLKIDMFYDSAILYYVKKNQYDKAHPILKGWTDWLFSTGKLKKTPEELVHTIKDVISIEDLKEGCDAIRDKLTNKKSNKKRKP